MPKLNTTKESEEFDKNLGLAITKARKTQSFSLKNLAHSVGITYQMLQKHENGIAPLTVYRLRQICSVLQLPVTYFLPESSSRSNTQRMLPLGDISPATAKALAKLVQSLRPRSKDRPAQIYEDSAER